MAAGPSAHRDNPFAVGPAINRHAFKGTKPELFADQVEIGHLNGSLLDYIPNYALNRLAASCSISLGNTEEEHERNITEMRKREKEWSETLSAKSGLVNRSY